MESLQIEEKNESQEASKIKSKVTVTEKQEEEKKVPKEEPAKQKVKR